MANDTQPSANDLGPEDTLWLYGTARASDTALVAALLSGSQRRRIAVASRLLWETGGLWSLTRIGLRALRQLGLGRVEATRLAACMEVGRRTTAAPPAGKSVREPRDAYLCVANQLIGRDRERFVVVVLDIRNRPRSIIVVAEGAVDSCAIDPREVFAPAVRERGSAVLLAHNHPSGDPTPSSEDVALTERLGRAGRLLGIPVLDHIVVGARRGPQHDASYVSLSVAGLYIPERAAR